MSLLVLLMRGPLIGHARLRGRSRCSPHELLTRREYSSHTLTRPAGILHEGLSQTEILLLLLLPLLLLLLLLLICGPDDAEDVRDVGVKRRGAAGMR